MKNKLLQITSGKGPAECCRVVFLLYKLLAKQAEQQDVHLDVIDSKAGQHKGGLLSITMNISGAKVEEFLSEWVGTILWIAQSPYRKNHKRKNWFIGIEAFDTKDIMPFNEKDVRFETCRASGPGGQNVNKVETAVRGTHIPSGLQVLAMDARSQLENKKLCITRLRNKIAAWAVECRMEDKQKQWTEHNGLTRGNPVKTFIAKMD